MGGTPPIRSPAPGKTLTVKAAKPKLKTNSAGSVKGTSATLHGSVNAGGAKTTYYFEYGTSMAYGSKTAKRTLKPGDATKRVSVKIKGLKPGTTYHFRVLAKNSAGSAKGKDRTFTTAA